MAYKRIVPIIMGSEKDHSFARGIGNKLKEFEIEYEYRVASAHKHPELVLKMVAEYDEENDLVVYETVAGRSNALSGLVSCATTYPVIACPPDEDKTALQMDIMSSLRTPSDCSVMVALGAGNAALAAVKMFSLYDDDLKTKLEEHMNSVRKEIEKADKKLRNG